MILVVALAAGLTLPILLLFSRNVWVAGGATVFWLGLGGVTALREIRLQRLFRGDRFTLTLCALPLVGVLQLIAGRSANSAATLEAVCLWVSMTLLFVAARHILHEPDRRRRFLDLAVRIGAVVTALSLLQFLTSDGRIYWTIPTELPQVLGPFRNRNHFAAFVELVFPLAFLPFAATPRKRAVFGPIAAGMIAAVVVGGSRAGMALLAAEALLILIRLRRWAAAGGFLAVLLAAVPFAAPDLLGRDDGHRLEIYASTLDMIAAKPWTGWGLGTFEAVYPAFARFDNGLIVDHAHNDWLEWTAEAGIVAVIPLIILVIWSARAAWAHPWALGVPTIFLHALVDYPVHKPPLAAWTLVLLAALILESRKSANPNETIRFAYNKE